MQCHEVQPLIATARDLPFMLERELQAHLASCPACAASRRLEEHTTRVLQTLPVSQARPPERVVTSIEAILASNTRHRGWAPALAGAVLCVVLLGLLLGRQPIQSAFDRVAASRAPDVPQSGATQPTGNGAHGTLFIVSSPIGSTPSARTTRVTVADLPTLQERRSIDIVQGSERFPEVIASPDGRSLYAAIRGGPSRDDQIIALDAQTDQELWRTTIQDLGPNFGTESGMAVSPDGSRLYIRSLPGDDLSRREESTTPYWLQIVDTATGTVLPQTIPLRSMDECGGGVPMHLAPAAGNWLYVACAGGDVLVVDTESRQIVTTLQLSTGQPIVLTPGDRRLYYVGLDLRAVLYDPEEANSVVEVDLDPTDQFLYDLLAVSADGQTLAVGRVVPDTPGAVKATELRVYDVRTSAETGRFRIEQQLRDIVLDTDGGRLYGLSGEAGTAANTILEIDPANGRVQAAHPRPEENIIQLFARR